MFSLNCEEWLSTEREGGSRGKGDSKREKGMEW